MRKNEKIRKLYISLKRKYDPSSGQWSPWAKRPKTNREKERVVIEAILTQRTNWRNVQIAMANLKENKADSLKRICKFKNKNELAPLIKSSGFYKQKSGYLMGLAKFILRKYGGLGPIAKEPILELREELLNLKGIGPETADSILLYALEKPVFVIDEYTRRLLIAKRIAHEKNYEKLRELFENNLPKNWRLYQDFHALIVIAGKN